MVKDQDRTTSWLYLSIVEDHKYTTFGIGDIAKEDGGFSKNNMECMALNIIWGVEQV